MNYKINEEPTIRVEAERYGVDWRFIAAIRRQEDGGPGREFGVLSEHAPDYNTQLSVCCESVAHRVFTYPGHPFVYTRHGLIYSYDWIKYFAGIWCPVGATNDPDKLNVNWLPNVLKFYHQYLAADS